ncbi:MAG TPA: hypothetical protein VGI17_11780 [Solirubrobacterales bacterium]|jgi:cell division septum initiation protein DivIVA
MNPNNMNVAKAMVAQHELLEEARRSRLQAQAERHEAKATAPRATHKHHGILGLLGLG